MINTKNECSRVTVNVFKTLRLPGSSVCDRLRYKSFRLFKNMNCDCLCECESAAATQQNFRSDLIFHHHSVPHFPVNPPHYLADILDVYRVCKALHNHHTLAGAAG